MVEKVLVMADYIMVIHLRDFCHYSCIDFYFTSFILLQALMLHMLNTLKRSNSGSMRV